MRRLFTDKTQAPLLDAKTLLGWRAKMSVVVVILFGIFCSLGLVSSLITGEISSSSGAHISYGEQPTKFVSILIIYAVISLFAGFITLVLIKRR